MKDQNLPKFGLLYKTRIVTAEKRPACDCGHNLGSPWDSIQYVEIYRYENKFYQYSYTGFEVEPGRRVGPWGAQMWEADSLEELTADPKVSHVMYEEIINGAEQPDFGLDTAFTS